MKKHEDLTLAYLLFLQAVLSVAVICFLMLGLSLLLK